MRMSEASARMHLRDHVREDDVDLAIKVLTTHSLSLSLSLLLINYHLLLLYAILGDVRVVSTGSKSICASIFTEKLPQILNIWRSKQSAADA